MTLKLQQIFPNLNFIIITKNSKERIISFNINTTPILLAHSTVSSNSIYFSNLIQNIKEPIGKKLFSKSNKIKRKAPLVISIINDKDIKNKIIKKNLNNYTKPIIKRESLFSYEKETLKIEEYFLI